MKYWAIITIQIAFVFSLFSCKTIDLGYVKKTEVEKQIATLKTEWNAKLEESNRAISTQKDEIIAAKQTQVQAVANALYGQSIVFKSVLEPTRADLILMNLSEEGWLALNHLLPDYPTMLAINERIAKELDATKTTLVDLKKSHDAVMAQNQKLVDDTAAKQKALNALEKAQKDAEIAFHKDLDAKQKILDDKNNEIIAQKESDLKSKKARDAQLAKLSWGAGILAALCLAAALFSPVYKTELGIAAAAMAGGAVSIPFVQLYMVLIGFGLIAAAIIIWALRRFHVSDKTNNALINSLHDIEQNSKDVYDKTVAPTVAAYTTKYTKDAKGNVTTVEDKSITQQIDSKLIATDRK